VTQYGPEVDYAIMRSALEMFDTAQSELDDAQRTAVLQRVNREMAISKRLLEASESSGVVVPDAAVEQAYTELAQRFDDPETFITALKANNLNEARLREALAWQLRLDMVLEHLLNEHASVSDEEVEIYYYQHLEKFALPETRTARHILITINDEYVENQLNKAEKRLAALQKQLLDSPSLFTTLAEQNSECPTAMQGGLLGRIKPGTLYPQLDQALFSMGEGTISPIIETEVGLHLLLCETIHPAGKLLFEDVRENLRDHLMEKKRKHLLKEWLSGSQSTTLKGVDKTIP
jgi:peptidyl-prolyl cis-trans isomerase C